MKKSLLAPVLVAAMGLASSVASYGQGQIIFNNYFGSTSPIITYGNGPSIGLGVGPEIKAELAYFVGSSTASLGSLTPLLVSEVPFGLGVATSPGDPGSGWFNNGAVTVPGSAAQQCTFAILMYSGTTWALSTGPTDYRNQVPVTFGGTTQPDSTSGIPDLPLGAWQNQTVTQNAIPEPSSLALLGLGIAAFAARRRQS